MTDVLIRQGEETTDIQGESHVMMEANIRVTCLPTKALQGLLATPEAKRKAQSRFSPRDFSESMALLMLLFQILASRTVRE